MVRAITTEEVQTKIQDQINPAIFMTVMTPPNVQSVSC